MEKVYLGDCFEIIEKLPNVDYVFTIPPYNRKRNDKYKEFRDINNNYDIFLDRFVELTLPKCEYIFFNIQKNYYNKKDIFEFIGKYSEKIIDIIIWTKSNPMPASGFNITNSYEFIMILSDKHKSIKAKQTYTKNHLETSVYSENPHKKIHNAVMKPQVVEWFIERFTSENDIILDPFAGVGTTLKICKKHNRGFIGIEKEKAYFDIIVTELK